MSWAVVLVAVAVSIDGLWGGLAFGLRRVRIGPAALAVISAVSGACASLAMLGGHVLARTVPLAAAKWVSAALLLAVGVTMLYEAWLERGKQREEPVEPVLPALRSLAGELRRNPLGFLIRVLIDPTLAHADYSGDISAWEAGVLGFAVAIDASIAAFTIGLAGHASLGVPALMAAAHYLLVGLGNLLGSRRLVHRLTSRFVYLPGGLMVVLGLLRFR
ncbi:MAG: manganese efflux pump [Bacillota bacterium]|nr:manganese efflux pump [Bacillota bacterium]